MKPLHAALAALGLTALVGGLAAADVGAATDTVKVAAGEIQDTIIATATVLPLDGVADVHSRIDGRVAKVLVREGEHVEEGQVLAELEATEYTTALDRLEAQKLSQVAAADAELQAAQRSFSLAADRARRAQKLAVAGAESTSAATDAASARDIGAAELARARAHRELTRGGKGKPLALPGDEAMDGARRRLAWTKIVAPRAGSVLARRVDPGDVITAGHSGSPALFEIANPQQTEVLVEVEESDADRLEVDLDAAIVMPGLHDPLGRGRIARVGSSLHKRTINTQDARLRGDGVVRSAWVEWVGDRPGSLPLFSRLEVVVKLPPRSVKVRVPRSAVAVHAGHATVLLALGPLTRPRSVFLGSADDDWVEVTNLAPGSRVAKRNR